MSIVGTWKSVAMMAGDRIVPYSTETYKFKSDGTFEYKGSLTESVLLRLKKPRFTYEYAGEDMYLLFLNSSFWKVVKYSCDSSGKATLLIDGGDGFYVVCM